MSVHVSTQWSPRPSWAEANDKTSALQVCWLHTHTREIKKQTVISRPLFYSRHVVTRNIFCFWLIVVHPNITSIGAPLLADGVCRHVFWCTCAERVCACRPFAVLCVEACLLSVPVKSLLEYNQVCSPCTMLFPSTQPQFHWFLLKMTACKYILRFFFFKSSVIS